MEASLDRFTIKWKLGFQQVMITLFENIPFIDTWPTSLRGNRIEHLTVLQWIFFVVCTWSWKWNKISATCNIWVWPLQEKVSKWRDSNLKNVLYYKAHRIILIANVKIGVGIKKNILKKTQHTHPLSKSIQVREQSFPLISLDRAKVWGVGNPTYRRRYCQLLHIDAIETIKIHRNTPKALSRDRHRIVMHRISQGQKVQTWSWTRGQTVGWNSLPCLPQFLHLKSTT